MKTLFTFVIAAVLTIGIASAQEKGARQDRTPEERVKMQVIRLTKALELNQSQQDSIQTYLLQSIKTSTLHNNDVDNKVRKQALEARNSKIKSFLTKEQATKYEELQQKMKNRKTGKNNN